MEGYIYILRSEKNDSFYIGSTIDVPNRFNEHNAGLVKATKYLAPWKLAFSKRCDTIRKARQLEYKLKKFKSRKIIERIIEEKEIKTGS